MRPIEIALSFFMGLTLIIALAALTLWIIFVANMNNGSSRSSTDSSTSSPGVTDPAHVCAVLGGDAAPAATTPACPASEPRAAVAYCPDDAQFAGALTCLHLNQWSLNKTAPASPAVLTPGATVAPLALFVMATTKSSSGVVLEARFHLALSNTGGCPARIASLFVLIEQTAAPLGNDAAGVVSRQWAAAGAGAGGQCATLGRAPICTNVSVRGVSVACNLSAAYTPDSLRNAQPPRAPLDLAALTVPPHTACDTTNGGADVVALLALSDADMAALRLVPADTLRLTVLTTFDACCDRNGDGACGIDIDCDGTVETVRTLRRHLPLLALPAACAERCPAVVVRDALHPAARAAVSTACASAITPTAPASPLSELTDSAAWTLDGTLTCDATSCACGRATGPDATDGYTTLLGNTATLLPRADAPADDCAHPVTGASLLPAQATAMFNLTCMYLPAVPCIVSAWSAWAVSVPCAIGNTPQCQEVRQRSRSVEQTACHGGSTPCPSSLVETEAQQPCSQPCVEQMPVCNTAYECNGVDVCATRVVCDYGQSYPAVCEAGALVGCAPRTTIVDTVCSSTCTYGVPGCQVGSCSLDTCTAETVCGPSPTALTNCVDGVATLCAVNNRTSVVGMCATDCLYPNDPTITPTSSCNPVSCTQDMTLSFLPVANVHCTTSGVQEACNPHVSYRQDACTTPCAYSDWSDWSAWATCAALDAADPSSACAESHSRTRTPLSVCPLIGDLVSACTDTLASEVSACLCPGSAVPSPTPSPSPSTACVLNSDCIVDPANGPCFVATCGAGTCSVAEKICPSLDACTQSVCDAATGNCVASPKFCDDSNVCTNDGCDPVTGSCVHTASVPVTVSACQVSQCDPAFGNIVFSPLVCPAGTTCDIIDRDSLCRPPCAVDADCAWAIPGTGCIGARCSAGSCLQQSSCDCPTCYCQGDMCSQFNSDPCINAPGCPVGQQQNKTDCLCYGNPAVCVPANQCETTTFNYVTQQCDRTPIICPTDGLACTIELPCSPSAGCVRVQKQCSGSTVCRYNRCTEPNGVCVFSTALCIP